MIGSTRNAWFRDDEGTPNFEGTMDNIRVYDIVLSEEEVLWLKYYSEDPVFVPVIELPNLYDDDIINFLDHAKYGDDWEKYKPFG
jgi:hypothetical protein